MGSREHDAIDREEELTTAPSDGTEEAEVSGHMVDYHSLEQMAKLDHKARVSEANRQRLASDARTGRTRDGGLLDKVLRRREQ